MNSAKEIICWGDEQIRVLIVWSNGVLSGVKEGVIKKNKAIV